KDLALNGHDLLSEAGIPEGTFIGKTLNFLLETVLDDQSLNRKDKLLEIARNFYIKHNPE
ncbi:MAG: polynucleotide adenylyltransferase, partial [Spirochaetota bacterium]